MTWRSTTSFFLAAVLLATLAGCGPEDERVRIRIWHQKIGPERAFFQEAIARYNAREDSVIVEALYRENEENRNLYIIASVGGKGPDLFFGPADNVGVLAVTETILPLGRVLPESYLAQFTEEGIVSYNGTPWLVADQIGNHLMLVFNEAMIPTAPETSDELIRVLQENTRDTDGDGRPDEYGLTWNYREPFFFIPFLTGFGGWIMDEDGNPTLDTPEMVEAIEFVLDLRDRYKVIPAESDYEVAEALFKDGRAASVINGPWAWAGYAEAGIDYDLARIPKISSTGRWAAPVVSAKGYSVNANLPKEKLPHVRDLLRYLTGPEMQRAMAEELATVPVIASVRHAEAVQENPLLQASLRQIEVSRPMPIAPAMRQYWDGMRGPYQLIMNGAVTPEEGARLMQESVEERLADALL